MAELMDYKCPACSGALEFDPATQKMLCPFCGSSFEMAQLQAKDVQMQQSQMQQPQSQQWQSAQADEWNDGNVAVYRCESCGGEIVGDETTAATACPFCGNPVVMAGRVSGEFKPEYVLPFQLEKKAATEKLKQYLY